MLTFIPSPVDFEYEAIFRAVINRSGRMQYYKMKKGKKQQRISKSEFSDIYNKSRIIAIKPIQTPDISSNIQMELYVK